MNKKDLIIGLILGVIIGLVAGLNFSLYKVISAGSLTYKINRLTGTAWFLRGTTCKLVEEEKPIVKESPTDKPKAEQVSKEPEIEVAEILKKYPENPPARPATAQPDKWLAEHSKDGPSVTTQPVLKLPFNNAILDNGRTDCRSYMDWYFSWTAVSGATEYQLLVQDNEKTLYAKSTDDVKQLLAKLKYLGPIRINITTTNTFYKHKVVDLISYVDNYRAEWSVRAKVNGVWQDWLEKRYFTVEPLDTDFPTITQEQAHNELQAEEPRMNRKDEPTNVDAKK
jgi:hypothetical protein